MTATTMKSFAKSTGKTANQRSGQFSGVLLGKLAEGWEALEAIGQLALGHANHFMELAIQAARVAKRTLEAAKTIPFATQDIDFNAAINPAARKAPALGMGASGSSASKKKRDSGGTS